MGIAAARNVRYLDVLVDGDLIHLPGALFSCATLEFLRLSGSLILEVLHETDTTTGMAINLPKLEVLELSKVIYESDESFHKLISSCPVLHSLTINRDPSDVLVVCAISSRSLKFLQIDLPPGMYEDDECVQLKLDTPTLEHLILCHKDMSEILSEGLKSLIKVEIDVMTFCLSNEINLCSSIAEQVIQVVNRAKGMKLSRSTVETLDSAMTRLSTPFDRLTELHIEILCSQCGLLDDMLHCSTLFGELKSTSHRKFWA